MAPFRSKLTTSSSPSAARSTSPDSGGVDGSAPLVDDVVNFERNGAISDKGLAPLNVLARTASSGGTAAEPDRTRAYLLRSLGRLERRDLITPISSFRADSALRRDPSSGAGVDASRQCAARRARRRDHACRDSLIPTSPPAILGQLRSAPLISSKPPRRAWPGIDAARGRGRPRPVGPKALARRNRKLGRLSDETLALLRKGVGWELPVMNVPADEPIARESFAALMAARGAGRVVGVSAGEARCCPPAGRASHSSGLAEKSCPLREQARPWCCSRR